MSTAMMGITLFGLFCLFYVVQGSDRKVFVATPNVLRLDAEETITIATTGVGDDPFTVFLQDFPARKNKFSEQIVMVQNGKPTIARVKVTHDDIPDIKEGDVKKTTYVYLVVTGNGFSKEHKLPVRRKSGYLFIQTDKPIYTPQQTVGIRIIPVNEYLLPKDGPIHLQIRNPQGVVVQEKKCEQPWRRNSVDDPYFPTHNYQFPPHPLLGEWSVVALYGHKLETNSSVHFKVDEYVLPTFTVMLDVPNAIMPGDTHVHVRAHAEYVYGKKVKGTAIFKFGIKHKLGNIIEIGSKTNELQNGEASVTFRREEITENPQIESFPLDSKLFVKVDVVDSATGLRESAINEECTFANSPYVISFKRSLKDFKPGLVSVIMADVTYINGQPAAGVPTSISVVDSNGRLVEVKSPIYTSDDDGHVLYNVNTYIGSPTFTITIKTNDRNYEESQQYTGTHVMSAFQSNGGYIAISRLEGTRVLKVGSHFSATVFAQPFAEIHDVFFLVVSRGRIVERGSTSKDRLLQRELNFRVTPEMSPSIRIVVYAIFKEELIADSLRIEVEHKCHPDAEVEIERNFKDTTPGSEGNFLLKGFPETKVGILAVDNAVYSLRNKDRLTKDKLFKTLEKDDLGCGPGGGIDTEFVLANAGITIFGDFKYSNRENTDCAERRRRKREAIDAMVNKHDIDSRKCCKLAIIPDKYGRTCEERTEIVRNFTYESDGGKCTYAFMKCCKDVMLTDDGIDSRGRSGGVDEDLDFVEDLGDEKEASVRKDFRETWLFTDGVIGPDGETGVHTNLPHSITTWIIQAVSISDLWGMCVSEPKELVSFKNIFLQLNLPYAVVQNEQVEIQATVFNYNSRKVPVIVYMYGVEDLCTGVPAGEKSERKKVIVEPHSTVTVGFPVVPLKVKEYTLRVVALSQIGSDVIEKKLRVVARGMLFEETIPLILDPSNQKHRKERNIIKDTYTDSLDPSQMLQLTAVKLRPSKDYIPGTERCVISAIGDEFGPTVETVLHNPENLVRLPIGCGEQTMMFMGPTVYTLHYLKIKGKVTPEFEGKVYGFVREGYNRELTFRKNDGSYSAFQNRPSSTWLTAYVMKIFCQSSKFIFIDQNVICTGMTWLTNHQNADGSFTENHPLIHFDMLGGLKGAVPMTAFVLISLHHCSCEFEALKLSKARALLYLEGQLPTTNDAYALSLVSYALALSNSDLKFVASEKLRSLALFNEGLNQRYWSIGSQSHIIETTAYALLSQLALEDMSYSMPIVNWLNTQRLAGGLFPSTQDTVIALEALSQYAIRAQSPEIDLECNVTYSKDKKVAKRIHFKNDNADILQEFVLDSVGGTVFFRTTGRGVGLLSVKLRYNVAHPMENLCKFDVTVNVTEAKPDVKPAVVINGAGKDFFDEIPIKLIEQLGIEDDHAEFRENGEIEFDDNLIKNDNFDGIDARIKNRGGDDDKNRDIDYDDKGRIGDDNEDDRDRVGDENFDDRDRVGDENFDDRVGDENFDDRDRAGDVDYRDRVGGVNDDERGRIAGDTDAERRLRANSKVMLQVTICAKYISNKTTDMAIIDAGVFSGFVPERGDLEKLLEDQLVDRYEMAGRSIIFYLNHVSFEKPVCLKFRIKREFIVGAVQPTVIKVYDYYNTEEACTVFYSPDSNSALLRKICEGSVCQCAEGGCPLNEPFSSLSDNLHRARDQLLLEACEKHNYVWRGIVESQEKKDGFIRIVFRITKVLKPGVEPRIQIEGLPKTLLLQDMCTSFEFINNKEYLIMGKDGERFEDRKTKQLEYRYLIDKTTTIHQWTLIREAKNRQLQKALNWLSTQLSLEGCRN